MGNSTYWWHKFIAIRIRRIASDQLSSWYIFIPNHHTFNCCHHKFSVSLSRNKSILKKNKKLSYIFKHSKNCNLTVNKSKETRVEAYTCRYSSKPLIPNSATASLFIKAVYPVSVTEVRLCCICKLIIIPWMMTRFTPKLILVFIFRPPIYVQG